MKQLCFGLMLVIGILLTNLVLAQPVLINKCPEPSKIGNQLHKYFVDIQRSCSTGSASSCDQAEARALEEYRRLSELCFFNAFEMTVTIVPPESKNDTSRLYFKYTEIDPQFKTCTYADPKTQKVFLCEFHATKDMWKCTKTSGNGENAEYKTQGRICVFKYERTT